MASVNRTKSILNSDLPQCELHRDLYQHIDGLAAQAGRSKAPLPHRRDCPLVEAGTRASQHAHVADRAVGPDHNLQQDVTYQIAASRLIGVGGLDLAQLSGRLDAAARTVRTSSRSAAAAFSNAGT
jgi:hypothetical protein